MDDLIPDGAKSLRPKPSRDAVIHVRVPRVTRDLIARAAEMSNQTLTSFVLDCATRHATDVLLDQRLFVLDEEAFAHFVHTLDDPPEPSEALRELMTRPSPWEM